MEANPKRQRLIDAAKTMFYTRGVEPSSLGEIARAAEVPPGNVYYHFKTKDALIEAVIASHGQDILEGLARLNAQADPRARLLAFVRGGLAHGEQLARYGCPYGTLCAELEKTPGSVADSATVLFPLYLHWLERQFAGLGQADAADLALDTLAAVQGAYVITHSTRSPQYLERQVARLEGWIQGLEPGENIRA
ncbi:TetR/AcrR family transcriptional regulator [Deinococcus arenicola]|uniref:TetR/AcrR family transcriptional regulator n=1 Tax=Deinococcus arenicola TaxID=2994950 RepID=A0ABU4DLE5_9DEIO|nr:TetR/AcrR family transcriptional regulator [Deinococcus sp. ZS9-10]MDV6373256.1 TetR/AcrR family transcriptional regulator [Deinococcus sp. ZS9-10]